MPWHIGTSDDCPASKPHAVIKDATDEVEGCHETEEKAQAQMAALYANETKAELIKAEPLKAERLTNTKWRVLAIPFGGPKAGKDTDEEFFSPRTDIKADWFDKRPTIWHHNLDKTMKADSEIGTEDDLEQEDDGWWATVWLNRAHDYWSRIDKWLRDGKIYGSSGTLPHFREVDRKTGEILVWPHIEQTLTLTPANPYARVSPAKALAHFKSAGIAVDDEIRRLLNESDRPSDLGPDLPQGGDDPAMAKLAEILDQLAEVLKTLRP